MKVSRYKLLGEYQIASAKDLDDAYRLLCFCKYYILQFKFPFWKKVEEWISVSKVCKITSEYSSGKRKHIIFPSIAAAQTVIAQLEEKRLCNELGRWNVIKHIGDKNELEGPKITYDKEMNLGYIYLTREQIPVEFMVPSSDDLFVFDFDKNDQLIGIEFKSLEGLAKLIQSNVVLSTSQKTKST